MRFLKPLFDFYLQSSVHVAFSVMALIYITYLKLNIPVNEAVIYFGFFGTIVAYNFIKYDEIARVKKIKLTNTFKAIIAVSFVSGIVTLYYFFQLSLTTKIIAFATLFLTILYTLPFFPHTSNMRNWSGVKIYLVAITWVGVTVFLPVIDAGASFSSIVILKCFQRFILVYVLMLIFEIIDLQFDDLKLKTMPQKLGIKKTKQLNYALILVFFIIEFFKKDTLHHFLISSGVVLILLLFTYFASSKRSKYYSSFWVESVPLFWLLLLLAF